MENRIPVTDMNIAALKPYQERSERQLLRMFEPEPGVFVAESPNVIRRALTAGYEALSFLVEESQIKGEAERILQDCPAVPTYVATEEVLRSIIGYDMTRGVLSLMRRRAMPAAAALVQGCRRIVVLEDVMNPTNLGAIFRSAAALGVDAVLLTAGCTDPLYRRSARVSMGTVFQVPWTILPEETDWISMLHELNYKTAAMALHDDSYSLEEPALKEADRLAIIMGTEGEGLRQATIDRADFTVKIPMTHDVDSLNVAAASAVTFWELCQRPNGRGEV